MADSGFPVGRGDPFGGANLQRGHFLAETYVKMKELGPVRGGGGLAGGALDPPMHTFSQKNG